MVTPWNSDHGPGPAEAVAEFLERNDAFVRDERREKFLLTFNPGGYLEKRETATGSRLRLQIPPRSPVVSPPARQAPSGQAVFSMTWIPPVSCRSTSGFSDPGSRQCAATRPRTS